MDKRLFRSTKERKLCGVCGGLGEYFDIDPTVIRLIWVLVCLLGGAGVLAYIICALVIPEEKPDVYPPNSQQYYNPDNENK